MQINDCNANYLVKITLYKSRLGTIQSRDNWAGGQRKRIGPSVPSLVNLRLLAVIGSRVNTTIARMRTIAIDLFASILNYDLAFRFTI